MGFNFDSVKDKLIGPAKDLLSSSGFGPRDFELYQGNSGSVKQFITRGSGDVKFALDSLMFNFPSLDVADSFSLFDYEFVIHNGQKVLARLVLPMPPQSVGYSVPTTTQTTVTMRGVTEEHNGAPLRPISLAGTFGVYPVTTSVTSTAAGQKGPLDYLFNNTVTAVNRVADTVRKLSNAFSDNNGTFKSPLVDESNAWVQTSYTVAHNMDRFFSAYLEAKKGGTIELYLGFNMHKDKMYFDCTLNNYSIRKQAGTVEYMYQIGLTAWRRREAPIGTAGVAKSLPSVNSTQSQNVFARLNTAIQNSRNLIGQSLGILKGIQGDISQNILTPLKQIGLLVKDAQGLSTELLLTDFPDSITNEAKQSVTAAWADILNKKSRQTETSAAMESFATNGVYTKTQNPIRENVLVKENTNTMYLTDTDKQFQGIEASSGSDLYKNPDDYLDVFALTPIGELELPSELREAIENEIEKARSLTYQDIGDIRDQLTQFTSLLSQRLGGQDPVYNQVFGIDSVDTDKKLTTEDIEFLVTLDDAANALDELVVILRDNLKTDTNDYAKFYGEYARTQGIDFQENTSKFYVPFPLGASLESLAVQYLGDQRRWIEIAAINGLKQPYVDEEGSYRKLTSSGSGNSFFVASSDSIYIGQVIQIMSDTKIAENRRVVAFDIISEIQTLVTVSGEADLAKFKLSENAKIRIFAPDTVNSRMLIAIPTTTPVNVPGTIQLNPSERDLTNIAYVAKSDFMLVNYEDGTSDVGFIGSDVAIAEGMQNIVQAANIKLKTQRGELVNDPEFGNPIIVGDSVADFDANTAISQLSSLFEQDSRFNRVAAARIKQTGGAVSLDILLDVVRTQAYLPLTTVIPWV